jgi:hypothetical protein
MKIVAIRTAKFEGVVNKAELAEMRRKGWHILEVDGKDVVGVCEGCGKLILTLKDYFTDCEGVVLCKKCWRELIAEQKTGDSR